MTRFAIACAFATALVGATVDADDEHVKKVEAWRAQHEADYRRDYVPLAGLFSLKEGVNSVGSRAGSDVLMPRGPASVGLLVYRNGQVRFEPSPAVRIRLNGTVITAPTALRPDGGSEPADELQLDDMALWVHMSGERHTIRMRDPRGEVARTFAGFRWFPVDAQYRVVAKFIKDPKPREIQVASLTGDPQTYTTEGVVEFTLNGQQVRLRPMTTRPNRFFFVFKDATAGKETYEAARFLYSDLMPDGTTVLDFNEAYNPPCAFNPYTTCPLPLPENRLSMRIPAGELNYTKQR